MLAASKPPACRKNEESSRDSRTLCCEAIENEMNLSPSLLQQPSMLCVCVFVSAENGRRPLNLASSATDDQKGLCLFCFCEHGYFSHLMLLWFQVIVVFVLLVLLSLSLLSFSSCS